MSPWAMVKSIQPFAVLANVALDTLFEVGKLSASVRLTSNT